MATITLDIIVDLARDDTVHSPRFVEEKMH